MRIQRSGGKEIALNLLTVSALQFSDTYNAQTVRHSHYPLLDPTPNRVRCPMPRNKRQTLPIPYVPVL